MYGHCEDHGMTHPLVQGIVTNTGPLTEEYLPSAFPGREAQLRELADCLISSGNAQRPRHVWAFGPPGSGKSSVVRRVLGQLEEQRVRTAYVNCWSAQTFYAVLETVLQEFRALVGEMRDVSFKFERLGRIAKEHHLVIVLDECDQMFLKERNAAIYNLARMNHSGLVCLSQSRKAYLDLDPRVQSRLLPEVLEFPSYSVTDLIAILEARAERSLSAEAWCRKDLQIIARQSEGDARIAIQTLRTAAYLAEKGRGGQIRPEDIREGLRSSSALRQRYLLKSMSEHHRLLFQLVKTSGSISTVELWRRYEGAARQHGLEPMARRTFNLYKQHLLSNRLLTERQGRGKRNRRLLEIA